VRFYFVKDARIVADKTFPSLSPDEAVATAGKMLQESASRYDGIEVWSLTRRICRLGHIARNPPAKPSKPRKLFGVRLAPA
jgi:hypothetical protein